MSTALGLSESATRQVVSAAGMAPSLFNTQPWRFRLCPDRIEVHADLGRRLIGHDPEDRELRIACGAALFNLRLALHAHGVTPVVTIEPGDQAVPRRRRPVPDHAPANQLGLTASFLSQPIEVTEQHRQLTTLLANRLHPQAILRLGFSPPVTAATSTPMSPLTIRATTICALPVQSSRSTVTR